MENRRETSRSNFRSDARALCSISSAGVVFFSEKRMPLSSEISFNMETEVFGLHQEWQVKGWVVGCESMPMGAQLGYKVTLLFHDLPDALISVLEMTQGARPSFPMMDACPTFGLN